MSESNPSSLPNWRSMIGRMREIAFGMSHNGNRNLWEVFGYPDQPTATDFRRMYERGDLAYRIIRAFPQATWADRPSAWDENGNSAEPKRRDGRANPEFSPFTQAWEDFCEDHGVQAILERADRLAGIGQYSILVMGFNDGLDLHEELPSGKHELLWLQPYCEDFAKVTTFDEDTNSPRFGLPKTYTVTNTQPAAGGTVRTRGSMSVHHSRVIHIAEALTENDVYGMPRLQPVFNRLVDLEKVSGSASESFWLNARGAMVLNADKDATFSPEEVARLREQADEFEHQLRRMMALQGTDAKMLNAPIADPGPIIEALVSQIAGGVGIPKRILIGSERGELASSQDERGWVERIDERRQTYVAPAILRPFQQKLIDTGNLPMPKGKWGGGWDAKASLSPKERAEVGKAITEAVARYAGAPGSELVMPLPEFRETMGLPPESEYEVEEPDEEEATESGDGMDPANPVDESDPEVVAQFRALQGGRS